LNISDPDNLTLSLSLSLSLHRSSQFEEKFEEINGVEVAPNVPSSSGFDENPATTMVTEESKGKETEMQGQDAQRMCSDLNASQDFVSGIMKIVPSDVDVSLALDLYDKIFNKLFFFFFWVTGAPKKKQLQAETTCSAFQIFV